ncbi:MAG: hypothetical protein R3229_15780 [Alphaproteobacteria bacterium]|nr:hypothetical protein [Alphaproteobacteria bacterium]
MTRLSPKTSPVPPVAPDPEGGDGPSQPMAAALNLLAAISSAGQAIVPRQPTAAMLSAGARTAGVPADVIEKAWRAMLAAAD